MSENKVDAKDLKIMAYKERVTELTEANADLRVELTIISNQLNSALSRLAELESSETKQNEEDQPSE